MTREHFRTLPELLECIPESNWYFVRNRGDKPTVCNKVKADVMIDDNQGICIGCKTVSKTKHVIWFKDVKLEYAKETKEKYNIVNFTNWNDVYEYIVNLH